MHGEKKAGQLKKGKGEKRNMENKGKTEKKQKKRTHTAVRIWRKTWKQEMPTL
ncbi:MAG: hypothetical protein IJL88_09990 [Clostridia bacterium]|nr:hypothetical protein [Clostridia bacterium]